MDFIFKTYAWLIIACLFAIPMSGQIDNETTQKFWTKNLQEIALSNSRPGWIYLKDLNMDAEFLINRYKAALQIGSKTDLRLKKKYDDDFGYKHLQFEQYIEGVPIRGAKLMAHINPKGFVYLLNGNWSLNLQVERRPEISKRQVLSQVKKINEAKYGLWHNKHVSSEKKTFLPEATLVIISDKVQPRLAWEIDLFLSPPHTSFTLLIDALSGKEMERIPLNSDCQPVDITTPWYDRRTINTYFNEGQFALFDNCSTESTQIAILRSAAGNIFYGENNQWDETEEEIAQVTTMWGLTRTYHYYREQHNRESWMVKERPLLPLFFLMNQMHTGLLDGTE